eukprot:NODE_56_length_28873_cov_1.243101.p21 type:complete len:103 gc:universal NODE_56_length_28873_cov_1.243101:3307-3615(+)
MTLSAFNGDNLISCSKFCCACFNFSSLIVQFKRGSYLRISILDMIKLAFLRNAARLFSIATVYGPCILYIPNASTNSRVKRKGTYSGQGSNFDCSNANPKSI